MATPQEQLNKMREQAAEVMAKLTTMSGVNGCAICAIGGRVKLCEYAQQVGSGLDPHSYSAEASAGLAARNVECKKGAQVDALEANYLDLANAAENFRAANNL